MLVRIEDWNLVREKFDGSEKSVLNEAITGQTICPRGVIVDEQRAASVGIKLKNLIAELHG